MPAELYLLQADGVRLRLTVFPQVELLVKLLCQMAVAALSKQGDFSVELHPSLKNILKVRNMMRKRNQAEAGETSKG